MQCREFEERLNLLLDERQPPAADAQLAAHVAACDSCRALLAGQVAVLAGLRQWQAPRLSADFSRRILAARSLEPVEAVVLEGSPHNRRRWVVVACLLSAAAVALVAVTIAALDSGGDPAIAISPAGPSQQRTPAADSHQPERAVARATLSPRSGSPRSGSPRTGTGRRPVQPSALALLTRPTGGYGVAIADMASNLPEAVEQLDEVERYAPGIRPIRVSFTMLFKALWRALPGAGSQEGADPSANFGPARAALLV